MPYYFNGKSWVTPATMSAIDDSAMVSTNLGVGNYAAYLGTATGGKPNTKLAFGSAAEAIATLRSGPLLEAIKKAFAPSTETGGPSTVYAVRVNPAVQSTLSLADVNGNAVISLASSDFGLWTKQVKVKIVAGSNRGAAITTQYQDNYYTQDDVARSAFTVQYTGSLASAAMSVNGTAVTLQAPSGTTVATIDLASATTYSQLVDYINSVAGWNAVLSDSAFEDAGTVNGLDYGTFTDVKTSAVTVTANLQAIIDWFNGSTEGYVTATRPATAGAVPAATGGFVFLAGGSDGVTTTTEWSNAFTTLQSIDAYWISPVSSNPAIWAMADAHVQYMSKYGRMERRAICGTPAGTTDAQAIAYAKALNSDRTSLVHIGYYDYNAAGNLQLFGPMYMAALLTGMFSGVNPGTALSNKTISVSGLERELRNPTDTDPLITGGVLCIESTNTGYKVVQSISTWLKDSKFNRREQSCGWAADYTARSLREALDVLRGQKNNVVALGRAKSIAAGVLNNLAVAEPSGPGVLAGDDKNPAWKNLVISATGDVLQVGVQASPVIPINYIPVSISLQVFTGTASA